MIGIVLTIMVWMVIGAVAAIQYNKKVNKIKELEQRLDEYYKEREKRLMAEDRRTTIENSVRGGSKPVVRINSNKTIKK